MGLYWDEDEGSSSVLTGRDDEGHVRENHEDANDRSQMIETTFRRGTRTQAPPCGARTHRHGCTSLGVAGTFYSRWEPPLQRGKRKEEPSYTAYNRPTVIIIGTSDMKQDTGRAETVAMVAG